MLCPGCNKTVSKNDYACPLCGYKLKEKASTAVKEASADVPEASSERIPVKHNKRVDSMTPEEKRELSRFMDTHNGMTPEEYDRQQAESTALSAAHTAAPSPSQSSEKKRQKAETPIRVASPNRTNEANRKSSSAGSPNTRAAVKTQSKTPTPTPPPAQPKRTSPPVQPQAAASVPPKKVKTKDKGNFLLNLICYFFPFVGWFYSSSAKGYYPKKAKAARRSAWLGIVLYIILTLFFIYGMQIEPVREFVMESVTSINYFVAEQDRSVQQQNNYDKNNKEIKLGLICLRDENSLYDYNFINAAKISAENNGYELVIKTGVPEDDYCEEIARELVESGCNIIFANSFGHEDYILAVAKDYPNVQFCHASGFDAQVSNIKNFQNAYVSVYEGRYIAGIVAGMKVNEMLSNGKISKENAKLGYVATFPYAEVISDYTAFFLGAKSVCPAVTLSVKYVNSWYDFSEEYDAAISLINSGCVVIGQYSNSSGVPFACEEENVYMVGSDETQTENAPNSLLITSRIDWTPYFDYIYKAVNSGNYISTDWCGSLSTGSIEFSTVNLRVAAGTEEAIISAINNIKNGKIHVFDTQTFTVNGKHLSSYKADVIPDDSFEPDTEVIYNGYFHEQEKRSAPYFNIQIDGITIEQ